MPPTTYASQLRDDLEVILGEAFPEASILRSDEPAVPLVTSKLHLVLGQPTAVLDVSNGGVVKPKLACSITLYYEAVERATAEDFLSDSAEKLAQLLSHAAQDNPTVVEKWTTVKDIAISTAVQPPSRRGRHGYTRAMQVRFTVFYLSPSI